MAGLFSPSVLRPPGSPEPTELGALVNEVNELALRGTSPAPRFSAFAARLPRPAPPTWPRDPPPIEAAELDEFLAERGSPMAGLGAALLEVGWRYNLDPRLLVAIAGADTGFGRVLCTDFNAWNWFWFEWCNSPFESWRQALDEVARGLRVHYLDQGLTDVYSIANRYGPLDDPRDTLGLNRHWPGNVIRNLEILGGSHCNLTWVPNSTRCTVPRTDPPPRPDPAEDSAEATAEAEIEEASEEPAEEATEGSDDPAFFPLGPDEMAQSQPSVALPTRPPTPAVARLVEPRDDVEPSWYPAEIAALPPPETEVTPLRIAAAASAASPPTWTYLATTLAVASIFGGRVLVTWRPRLPHPREVMLRRRARRDEGAPAKLAG